MEITERVRCFVEDASSQVNQKKRHDKIRLYAEGFKAKLAQADFALCELTQLREQTDANMNSTEARSFGVGDQVHFFCDAFWTFLYSSLDVLAQVVNQAMKLGLEEKDVSFKAVKKALDKVPHKGSAIHNALVSCIKSNAYKNVERYRNCSTHRRQIYIEERITEVRGTSGYESSTSGRVRMVERMLCDNPLGLSPKMDQRRSIPEFMEKSQAKIIEYADRIVRNIAVSG